MVGFRADQRPENARCLGSGVDQADGRMVAVLTPLISDDFRVMGR
jgi:hypothetical protein